MKKILVCLVLTLFLVQMVCCPAVFAASARSGVQTTTTAGTTTTVQDNTDETTAPDTAGTTDTTDTTATTETVGTTADLSADAASTNLIILDKEGKIAARLTDENGIGIPGVAVKIQIASTILQIPSVTDENGYAVFPYDMPASGTYIHCSTDATIVDGVLYAAAAASVGSGPTNTDSTTTTQEGETTATTAIPTYNRTNKVTTARKTTEPPTWYTYTATTGMEESYISLGFSFDSGILESFKTDETKFRDLARLLLSPETYAQIISDMKGTLLMTAAASATEVTDEHIAAALKDDAVLARTDPKDVERVVIDLALQLQSPTGKQTDVWTLAEDSYVIQLPIPHSMRSAKAIAVAAVTADGISAPVYTTVSKDGFLRFETTSPVGTIVLLGFKDSFLAAFTGDSAILAIIFVIAGVLCIGGAVFLYIYFFYLPKRAKKKEAQNAVEEVEQSVETAQDFPTFEEAPLTEGNERIDPTNALDIFEEDMPTKPTDGTPRSNIDIPL